MRARPIARHARPAALDQRPRRGDARAIARAGRRSTTSPTTGSRPTDRRPSSSAPRRTRRYCSARRARWWCARPSWCVARARDPAGRRSSRTRSTSRPTVAPPPGRPTCPTGPVALYLGTRAPRPHRRRPLRGDRARPRRRRARWCSSGRTCSRPDASQRLRERARVSSAPAPRDEVIGYLQHADVLVVPHVVNAVHRQPRPHQALRVPGGRSPGRLDRRRRVPRCRRPAHHDRRRTRLRRRGRAARAGRHEVPGCRGRRDARLDRARGGDVRGDRASGRRAVLTPQSASTRQSSSRTRRRFDHAHDQSCDRRARSRPSAPARLRSARVVGERGDARLGERGRDRPAATQPAVGPTISGSPPTRLAMTGSPVASPSPTVSGPARLGPPRRHHEQVGACGAARAAASGRRTARTGCGAAPVMAGREPRSSSSYGDRRGVAVEPLAADEQELEVVTPEEPRRADQHVGALLGAPSVRRTTTRSRAIAARRFGAAGRRAMNAVAVDCRSARRRTRRRAARAGAADASGRRATRSRTRSPRRRRASAPTRTARTCAGGRCARTARRDAASPAGATAATGALWASTTDGRRPTTASTRARSNRATALRDSPTRPRATSASRSRRGGACAGATSIAAALS